MPTGADSGSSASFNTSFTDISTGLFGSSGTTSGSGSSTKTGSTTSTEESTSQLKIDEIGIMQMIDQALKGTSGIAEIFGLSAGSGLFDSSGAKQGTEDLLAKIAGELAKVTGVTTTSRAGGETVESQEDSTSSSSTESDGIFDSLGIGGIFQEYNMAELTLNQAIENPILAAAARANTKLLLISKGES